MSNNIRSHFFTWILGQNDRKTQHIIFSRIELLPEDEQEIVVNKFKAIEGSAGTTLREQNQFLMRVLNEHCNRKQARHVHDTAENR